MHINNITSAFTASLYIHEKYCSFIRDNYAYWSQAFSNTLFTLYIWIWIEKNYYNTLHKRITSNIFIFQGMLMDKYCIILYQSTDCLWFTFSLKQCSKPCTVLVFCSFLGLLIMGTPINSNTQVYNNDNYDNNNNNMLTIGKHQ